MTRFKKGKIEICLFYYSMKTRSIGCHLCSLKTLILTSDLQLVPIYRCDLLLSFPTSYAYHKEVHRRGRLFSTERYLRFFHIWARFVSICLANSSCTNCNGKYTLMIMYIFSSMHLSSTSWNYSTWLICTLINSMFCF